MDATLNERIDALLNNQLYSVAPDERKSALLTLLKEHVIVAAQKQSAYANYVHSWPIDPRSAEKIEDLPYLPVTAFKQDPPLMLCPGEDIVRTVSSSSTSGQIPSRVAIDAITARRMTKSVALIAGNFIGNSRRPYLVVDTKTTNMPSSQMGARSAAIRGLQPFSKSITYCLFDRDDNELSIDEETLFGFARANQGEPVLVYGFTYILWLHLIKPLYERGVCLNLASAHIMHSGGWKKLIEESVSKEEFNRCAAAVFGCTPQRVIDFYGMAENVGIIYPDCPEGMKHSPCFGEVIIRDPLTLKPVEEGGIGLVQVCSVLPVSFPGHLLLTEDLGQVVQYDACPCGRRGISFRFFGRVPKTEVRGCGNILAYRSRMMTGRP
jgi:hypothetical protein